MYDRWIAECLPCRWQEEHTAQDAAIAAAEEHVTAKHRGINREVQRAKLIGHVTQRTLLEPHEKEVSAATAAEESKPAPALEVRAELTAAAEPAAEE